MLSLGSMEYTTKEIILTEHQQSLAENDLKAILKTLCICYIGSFFIQERKRLKENILKDSLRCSFKNCKCGCFCGLNTLKLYIYTSEDTRIRLNKCPYQCVFCSKK